MTVEIFHVPQFDYVRMAAAASLLEAIGWAQEWLAESCRASAWPERTDSLRYTLDEVPEHPADLRVTAWCDDEFSANHGYVVITRQVIDAAECVA